LKHVSATTNDAGTFSLSITELTRLMGIDWTKDLKPDEAQAALDALNKQAPVTSREPRS
jgi:hypothetical protein